MTTVLWILGLVAALVVAVFAGQNAEQVRVTFLVWQTSAQLPVVIFISAVLGAVVTGILGAIPHVRTRIRLRHLTAELAQARAGGPQQQPSTAGQPPAAEPSAGPPPAPPGPPPAPPAAPADAIDAALAEALGQGEKVEPGESA